MSHSAVPKYLWCNRRELVTTWIRFLASAQWMDSQKRETDSQVEDGNEDVFFPFDLCHSVSHTFSLLVAGAFSLSSNEDTEVETSFSLYKLERDYEHSLRHAVVGMSLQESSIGIVTGNVLGHERKTSNTLLIPSYASWLTNECLKSMRYWLKMDNTVGDLNELESLSVLSESQWPNISFDASSQDISVHIPLHRGLALVIFRSIREWCDKSEPSYLLWSISADRSLNRHKNGDFWGQILEGCDPYGFSAYVMEHPLRIRVFCAQVNAGMWKMNGKTPIILYDGYRYVQRLDISQELDLFLLQCCAALAPPDCYVKRILERFGLSNYLSLDLEELHTEHEPILVAEMLTLLVQIVTERAFCGLTTAESLQRQFVLKLSVSDNTRSQLVKFLPGDLSIINQLQEVLDKVAKCYRPSDTSQENMYRLRPSYWKELDLYHPIWYPWDRKAALKRYKRFSKVSALTTQLPRWTNIYHPLKGIAKIATCKALVKIIRSVLFYAVFSASRVPDDVLVTALHLLSLALDVCHVHKESGDMTCYVSEVVPFLGFAREEICTGKNGFYSMWSLLILLRTTRGQKNLAEAGDFNILILNILKSFVEIEPWFLTQLQKDNPILADEFLTRGQTLRKRKVRSLKRQGAALVEKMKSLKLSNAKEDEEMKDIMKKQSIENQ